MGATYLQTSGEFDKVDPVLRFEAHAELLGFLRRYRGQFGELHLHAHLKRHSATLGSNPLLRCNLNLVTDNGRFNASEEGFGVEAAVKNALLDLRYQVERRHEMRREQYAKAEGRKAVLMES